jgi:hypothetical protein
MLLLKTSENSSVQCSIVMWCEKGDIPYYWLFFLRELHQVVEFLVWRIECLENQCFRQNKHSLQKCVNTVFKTTNKSECSHIFTVLYEAKLSFLFALLFFGKENEESTQYIILDEQSSSRQFFFFSFPERQLTIYARWNSLLLQSPHLLFLLFQDYLQSLILLR